jgi:hypothetical protein
LIPLTSGHEGLHLGVIKLFKAFVPGAHGHQPSHFRQGHQLIHQGPQPSRHQLINHRHRQQQVGRLGLP